MVNIVLVDNYDSFTYNLVQYLEEIPKVDLHVMSNDVIDIDHLVRADKIVISPGPGTPSTNGEIISIIRRHYREKPILGVCLGMQAIYEAFNGKLINLRRVFHGVTSNVRIVKEGDPLFSKISNPFHAGRYHSWICDPAYLPHDLEILAWDEDQEMMACRHKRFPVYGVQFHPESFLTPEGKMLIRNFVDLPLTPTTQEYMRR